MCVSHVLSIHMIMMYSKDDNATFLVKHDSTRSRSNPPENYCFPCTRHLHRQYMYTCMYMNYVQLYTHTTCTVTHTESYEGFLCVIH